MVNSKARDKDYQELLAGALQIFRRKVKEADKHLVAVQQVIIFLDICMEPGINMKELAVKRGMEISTVSRHKRNLSKFERDKEIIDSTGKKTLITVQEGLDLVEVRENLRNLKVKNMFLTKKGKELCEELTAYLRRAVDDIHER